jgi:hypothetical protein
MSNVRGRSGAVRMSPSMACEDSAIDRTTGLSTSTVVTVQTVPPSRSRSSPSSCSGARQPARSTATGRPRRLSAYSLTGSAKNGLISVRPRDRVLVLIMSQDSNGLTTHSYNQCRPRNTEFRRDDVS